MLCAREMAAADVVQASYKLCRSCPALNVANDGVSESLNILTGLGNIASFGEFVQSQYLKHREGTSRFFA